MRDKKNRTLRAFSIMESCAFSGLLAAGCIVFFVWVSSYIDSPIRSRAERVRADMRYLQIGLESYFVDHEAYPAWVMAEKSAPGFMAKTGPFESIHTLTTPILYISSYPPDKFATAHETFAYWAGDCKQGWIVYSPGPDLDYDIVPAEDYVPGSEIPSPALIGKTYDPTNGIKSGGDIYRIKK